MGGIRGWQGPWGLQGRRPHRCRHALYTFTSIPAPDLSPRMPCPGCAGLKLDPSNAALQSGLKAAEQAAAAGAGGGIGSMFSSPDFMAKLAMNPETRGFLEQPDFMAMLKSIQTNPSSFGSYMQDPRMMKVRLLPPPLPPGPDQQ